MCKMTLALAASVAANVARSSCDRTAISVEVRVPAAATKPGSFLVRGEEKALTTSSVCNNITLMKML